MTLDVLKKTWFEHFGRSYPSKIVAVGLNYLDHFEEARLALPSLSLPREPSIFSKLANTLIGDGDPILLPRESRHLDAEAELAIVIGQKARRVPAREGLDVVAGYTVANDVSARDLQSKERHICRSKNFDTFCPILPVIVPVAQLGDARNLKIIQRLNDVVLQDGNTKEFIFGVPELIEYVSLSMTLEPGDIILTGTPAGVGIFREPPVPLRPDDCVEIEIEGIGCLRNSVMSE